MLLAISSQGNCIWMNRRAIWLITCFLCSRNQKLVENFPEVLYIWTLSKTGNDFNDRIPQRAKINAKHARQVEKSSFPAVL